MTDKESIKLISQNKKAYHDYFIEETYECGISLAGTEVKSVRAGACRGQNFSVGNFRNKENMTSQVNFLRYLNRSHTEQPSYVNYSNAAKLYIISYELRCGSDKSFCRNSF